MMTTITPIKQRQTPATRTFATNGTLAARECVKPAVAAGKGWGRRHG